MADTLFDGAGLSFLSSLYRRCTQRLTVRRSAAIWLLLTLTACAQVPREAVDLSATIGRDVAELQRAHRETALLLFQRMRDDIDRFVDDVYAPYQINAVMARQFELANSQDPAERRQSLLLAVQAAFQPGADTQLQQNVLRAFELMVQRVRNDVEGLRSELHASIDSQQSDLLSRIDRSYSQIHYANSIVTGHLSSIVAVNEAQNEVLDAIGLNGLTDKIATSISNMSDSVAGIVSRAQSVENGVDTALDFANQLKGAITISPTSAGDAEDDESGVQ